MSEAPIDWNQVFEQNKETTEFAPLAGGNASKTKAAINAIISIRSRSDPTFSVTNLNERYAQILSRNSRGELVDFFQETFGNGSVKVNEAGKVSFEFKKLVEFYKQLYNQLIAPPEASRSADTPGFSQPAAAPKKATLLPEEDEQSQDTTRTTGRIFTAPRRSTSGNESEATQFAPGETFTFPQPAIQSYQPEDTSNIAGPAGPADEPSQELDREFEEKVDKKLQFIMGLGAYNIRNKQIFDIRFLQQLNQRDTPQPTHLHYLCNIILKTLKRNEEFDYKSLPSENDTNFVEILEARLTPVFSEYVFKVLLRLAGNEDIDKEQFVTSRNILLRTIATHIVLTEEKEKEKKREERDARNAAREAKKAREAKWRAIMDADKAAERERKKRASNELAVELDQERELINELAAERNELRAMLNKELIDEEGQVVRSERGPQLPSDLDPMFTTEMRMVLSRNMVKAARDNIPNIEAQTALEEYVDELRAIEDLVENGMVALYKETIINQQRAALVEMLFYDRYEKILGEHDDLMANIDRVMGQFSSLDLSQSFISAQNSTALSRSLENLQKTLYKSADVMDKTGRLSLAITNAEMTTMQSFVSAQEISFRETTENIIPPSPSPARASDTSPGESPIPSGARSNQDSPFFAQPLPRTSGLNTPVATQIGGNNVIGDSSGSGFKTPDQRIARILFSPKVLSSPAKPIVPRALVDNSRLQELETKNRNLRDQLQRRQQAAIQSNKAVTNLQNELTELDQQNQKDVKALTKISEKLAEQLDEVQAKLDACEKEEVKLKQQLTNATEIAIKHFQNGENLVNLLQEVTIEADKEKEALTTRFQQYVTRRNEEIENLLNLYTPRKEPTKTYNQGTQSAQAGPSTPPRPTASLSTQVTPNTPARPTASEGTQFSPSTPVPQRTASQQSAATQSSPAGRAERNVLSTQTTPVAPVIAPSLQEIRNRRQTTESATQPDPVIRGEGQSQTDQIIKNAREIQTDERQTGDQASQATQGIGQQLHNELMAKLLEQRNEQIAEIQKEFADQRNVLGLSRAEVERLQRQSVENNNRLRELQQDKQNIEGRLEGANQELLAAQDQLAQQERDRQELNRRLQLLLDDRPTFVTRDAQQQNQIETLQIGLRDADEEITRLTNQIANLQGNLNQGAAENIRLTQELTDLQAQLRALQARPVLTRDPNDTQTIADLQAQIRDLNLRLGMNRAAVPVINTRAPGGFPGGSGPPGGGGFGGAGTSQFAIFDPSRPATRDSRDYGSQSKFARTMSRELAAKNDPAALELDPQGYNVESVEDFKEKMKNLGIEYVDLTSDTDYLKRILAAHFNEEFDVKRQLIKAASKEGAWPLVYKPKYGDVTTQKLKNVAFLPTKTQGRVVNSDLGTVIIPGQSNYSLRREGLNYVVYSAGKKQTFGSAQEASYFVSSGGFGRKSYGPITERVFGTPTKNLSQAIY